jgi:hypothetical protein
MSSWNRSGNRSPTYHGSRPGGVSARPTLTGGCFSPKELAAAPCAAWRPPSGSSTLPDNYEKVPASVFRVIGGLPGSTRGLCPGSDEAILQRRCGGGTGLGCRGFKSRGGEPGSDREVVAKKRWLTLPGSRVCHRSRSLGNSARSPLPQSSLALHCEHQSGRVSLKSSERQMALLERLPW